MIYPCVKDRWLVMNITYGIPLFNSDLNKEIMERILSKGLVNKKNLENMSQKQTELGAELLAFIK